MTDAIVAERVEKIRAMACDDETAHSAEDTLHQDVLSAIAEGRCANPQSCARAALKTLEINFARWCA